MNALKKLLTSAISLARIVIKWRLSSPRVLIISDRNNWIGINYDAIIKNLLCSGFVVERITCLDEKSCKPLEINKDFRNTRYKDINLYRVSEYNICVALEEFPSHISFDKEEHRKAISEWFSKSSKCIDFYEKLVLEKKPLKLLISQGHNFDSAVIRALACVHGFDVVAVENTFNNNKIVWDDVSGITVNKNLAKNYFWKYKEIVEASESNRYVSEYLLKIKQMKSAEHQTPAEIFAAPVKKTVLFIGQVYTDSSTLFGINNFACPLDILECLVDYCTENGYHLVIKLHPKESIGNDINGRPYNNLTYRKICQRPGLLELISANGFVLDQNVYDTYSLIEAADVCVTVNSQAGLEALIMGKDLVLCGQSFYSGLGFTFEALNVEGLVCFLDQVLMQGISVVDPCEINKFFYITCEKYFMERSEESIEHLLAM